MSKCQLVQERYGKQYYNYNKNEYKILRKYQKIKFSEFVEYVFGTKLFAYQKILIDAFADGKKFYGRMK